METLAGIMRPEVIVDDGKVNFVKVNLGKPIFVSSEIPVSNGNKYFIMFNDKPSNTTPLIYVVKIPNKLKYKTIGIKIIARSKIILVIKEVVQYAVKFTKL